MECSVLDSVESVGLVYVTDAQPGIARESSGKGFRYVKQDGNSVKDPKELDRIQNLAIPPAYRRVWICAQANGHLQATGLDSRGRKQYRYHPLFRQAQEESKFDRMLFFGEALPILRARVDRDMALPGFPKPKVLATVVYLLERSLVRIGNEEYARKNKSFGLTTMRNRHVRVAGTTIEFSFLGKSKVRHHIEIHDRRLARLIAKLQHLPGQELFQYVDDTGDPVSISSADVNGYLQQITGEHFTAKDFRTWWGTLIALAEFAHQEAPASESASKRTISEVMKLVASQLGNTAAICRKCYVHPLVVSAFQERRISKLSLPPISEEVEFVEKALLHLIRKANHAAKSEVHPRRPPPQKSRTKKAR